MKMNIMHKVFFDIGTLSAMEYLPATLRGMPRILAAGLALALAGCALPALPGRMTTRLSEQTLIHDHSELRQAVQVGVISGGAEDDPLGRSYIRNADFADAVRQSLAAHAMLGTAAPVFRLDAGILDVERPIGGLSLEVTTRVRYRLIRLSTGQVVFDRPIEASFTQPFDMTILGYERIQLATEGAFRENMRLFLLALVNQDQGRPPDVTPAPPLRNPFR